MNEWIEGILVVLFLAVIAIGGFIMVLITQVWFWVAVIAITLINNLGAL